MGFDLLQTLNTAGAASPLSSSGLPRGPIVQRALKGTFDPVRLGSTVSFMTASGCVTTPTAWQKIWVNIAGKSLRSILC
jgi:hypothetical protein